MCDMVRAFVREVSDVHRIEDVRTCDIELLKKLLVRTLGPDVNVANVQHDTVIDFEAKRVGLGTAGPQIQLRGNAA
jgi:phosphosulfolactate synthase